MKLTKIIICFWFIQYLEILVSERAHVLWHDTIYRRNKKCRTYTYFSKIICFYDFHSPKKKTNKLGKKSHCIQKVLMLENGTQMSRYPIVFQLH